MFVVYFWLVGEMVLHMRYYCPRSICKPATMPKWRNGRRQGLKIPWLNNRAGSSPALGTLYVDVAYRESFGT